MGKFLSSAAERAAERKEKCGRQGGHTKRASAEKRTKKKGVDRLGWEVRPV